MSNHAPVFGVVPHYNNAETLADLIPQLNQQGYDRVYIIDDASTGEQREQFEALASEHQQDAVKFMRNHKNSGAGYTRNRVLSLAQIERHGDAILHFVDSDASFLTRDAADIGRELITDNVAMVGGLILSQTTGQEPRQMALNFEPRFSLSAFRGSILQLKADGLVAQGKVVESKALRARHDNLLQHWPDTTEPPVACEAFWCAEANLFVSAAALRAAGGFLEMRAHDVQLPALKLAAAGQECRFDPEVAVLHHDTVATTSSSFKDQLAAAVPLLKHVGLNYFRND